MEEQWRQAQKEAQPVYIDPLTNKTYDHVPEGYMVFNTSYWNVVYEAVEYGRTKREDKRRRKEKRKADRAARRAARREEPAMREASPAPLVEAMPPDDADDNAEPGKEMPSASTDIAEPNRSTVIVKKRQFPCDFPGCFRVGDRAFLRLYDMKRHQRSFKHWPGNSLGDSLQGGGYSFGHGNESNQSVWHSERGGLGPPLAFRSVSNESGYFEVASNASIAITPRPRITQNRDFPCDAPDCFRVGRHAFTRRYDLDRHKQRQHPEFVREQAFPCEDPGCSIQDRPRENLIAASKWYVNKSDNAGFSGPALIIILVLACANWSSRCNRPHVRGDCDEEVQ
eukprot:gnl/TRDRNA2_/TRDRNA2_147078_c0_seq1.p1 gnl/TRDRNA2_/TRDRNA2_147078_c0~~gnl/TRDRNA2_/TRDRNA2_147078_c0_seq1.p1  ORF type:complete len:339 (-),score=40.50 gnl/TRDRNA2_/TRDRNA2_147078_c0_seq1:68-1084(-)